MNLQEIKKLEAFFEGLSRNANEQIIFPNNEYAGDAKLEITRYAVLNNSLISNDLVTLEDGIKKQRTLHKLKGSLSLVDNTAAFTGNQQQKELVPFVLTPVRYGVMEEWDYTNLKETWYASELQKGVFNDRIPPNVVLDAILEYFAERLPNLNDSLYLRGKARTPYANFTALYQGFEEIIADPLNNATKIKPPTTAITLITFNATTISLTVSTGDGANFAVGDFVTAFGIVDGGGGGVGAFLNNAIYNQATYSEDTTKNILVVDVSGDIVTINVDPTAEGLTLGTPVLTNAKLAYINASNATETLLSIWSMIPEAIKTKEDFYLWCHPYVIDSYIKQDAARLGGRFNTPMIDLNILGGRLKRLPNMSPNNIIGIRKENAFLGVDDLADEQNMHIVDMFPTSNQYFMRARLAMATCVKVAKDIESLIVRPF